MGKRKKIISLIILITLAILVATPFVYVKVNKMIYAHRVTEYLIEEKKYTPAEIESVQGVWSIKLPPFLAIVKFKDEPDVEYIYFAHNDVLQVSHRISEEAQKKGKTKSKLKHFVPMSDQE
ncbi:DUF3139 domain-containing protein [Paenibacillus xylanexedens]|uniref:DUF3139 domain-containing protein n=1 Tax=Paenibacillus xylanexedens TaxID=528191 RepID=UPI00119D06BD|nr:DUF3139 domain-containing protein [Paenibacillus xylanexedens]